MNALRPIVVLVAATILLFGTGYPLLMYGIGRLFPHRADGLPIVRDGRLAGYEPVGQPFSAPGYFWGRPSAVDYNASATGGSNKGPADPGLIAAVQARIDTLLRYHPGLRVEDIPVDLVTASGSGLDPHISPAAALIQAPRVAAARGIPEADLRQLIEEHTEGPLWGLLGPPARVNVLRLNLALDDRKQ